MGGAMRFVLPFLVLAAAAPACLAQEDYDLATALAERGWYDLSEELFTRMSGASDAGVKAEGRYGLARIKILMAEKAESAEEKGKLYDKAIEDVQAFLNQFPQHRRRSEALSDIGYLYQSKGKALMAAAKAEPARLEEAEKAFGAAEKLFLDLIAQLKKDEKKPPDDPKDKVKMQAFDEWEEKLMFAKYNYATALFSHAETYRENPSKHADMKRLLDQMINFLNNDFMWQFERYLLAFDAFIYMGRAYQLLAETSEREKAEEFWKRCFTSIAKPRGLLTDPENRKSEAVREICLRALLFEMKARIAYGDGRRGPTAIKQYDEVARLPDDFFRTFPNLRFDEMGKAVRLEQARAFCKAGKLAEGVKRLQELARLHKDSWVENVAIDILGEYGGEQSVSLAVDAADNLFERGPAFLYRAMQKYRKALQATRKPEDQKFASYCWYQIGRSYYYLDRYYEAVVAFSQFDKPPLAGTKEAPQAAMHKLYSLTRIARNTKDKADEKALEDWRAHVSKTFPNEATDQLVRQTAIDCEAKQDFEGAVREWRKLAQPGKDSYEEALFNVGFNLYRQGDVLMDQHLKKQDEAKAKLAVDLWTQGLDALKKHLEHVEKLPTKDARVVKNAIGSILFSAKILVHPRVNRADEALAVSKDLEKRFPNADPKHAIAVMSIRLNAKVKKAQVQEAEEDLKDLKAKYDKERIGLDYYLQALAVLAGAFEDAAEREKGKDPEKFDLYAVRAANYYYDYYQLNPTAVAGRPEQAEAMAEKLFMAAEQRMKLGEAKLGKAGVEEARRIYAKCMDLYQGYLVDQERRLSKEQLRAIRRRITRCQVMAGQYDEAIKTYLEITREDPEMRDGSSHEDLADCYVEKAQALPRGADRNGLLKEADKVYARLSGMLMSNQTYNEHTWRLLYKHALAIFELDIDQLRFFYDGMDRRGYAPKWDEDEKGVSPWGFKAKFEELRKQLDLKVPPRKRETEEKPK